MNNNEVKEKKRKEKKKRHLSIQKIFNIISSIFIISCCIFYGGRFLSLYIKNNSNDNKKLIAEIIKEDNKKNDSFTSINGTHYFKGNEVNNYLKYSNLIWRVLRINTNNSVTLVLDNSITALAAGNTSFKDSYINMWLNTQEKDYTGILQNNLNKIDDYLTYTYTCNDKIDDTKNITCKDIIENTLITVPSLSDYVNSGGQKGFMNNEEFYYLVNTNSNNKIWYVDDEGRVGTSSGTDIIGIKPVITIKNSISYISGDGTKNNPYTLEDNNALFGSYIKLGEDIWRVYNVEGDNIKLSLNSHLKLNGSDVKYKYSTAGYYHNDTKEGSLAYYLKNTYLPTLNYKDIINEVKYSNGIYSNVTKFDYTKVLSTKVDTQVTTLSIGDIFLNPINSNYYTTTGVSENSTQMYVMRNNFEIYTKVSTSNQNVVPVISINKKLLNKGDGSLNNPFQISKEGENNE